MLKCDWIYGAAAAVLVGVLAVSAHAAPVTYDGITFPEGDISFADVVVSYEPAFSGGNVPTDPNFTDPDAALGPPDWDTNSQTGSVSLGSGGRITLGFTDNALTGSGDATHDLHIFEIGSDVEDTFVEISKNGIDWEAIGKVFGSTSSIDIDAFGFGLADEFFFVRLMDDPNEGLTTGSTVGADIDAVGAISTQAVTVIPSPAAAPAGLALLGVLGLLAFGRRRNRLA